MFSQKDKQWAYDRIGHSRFLIKDYGCLISCFAFLLKERGWNTNPGQLNRYLTRTQNAFNHAGAYYWGKIGKAYEIKETVEDYRGMAVPAQALKKLTDSLKSGSAIIQVDFFPCTRVANMHFVVAVSYSKRDDDILIKDPIDGKTKWLREAYGCRGRWSLSRAIYRIVYLEGNKEGEKCNHQCPKCCK